LAVSATETGAWFGRADVNTALLPYFMTCIFGSVRPIPSGTFLMLAAQSNDEPDDFICRSIHEWHDKFTAEKIAGRLAVPAKRTGNFGLKAFATFDGSTSRTSPMIIRRSPS
jgi:hypothetical protein